MRTLSNLLSIVILLVLAGCNGVNETLVTGATAVPPTIQATDTVIPTPIPTIAVTETATADTAPSPLPPTEQPTNQPTQAPTPTPTATAEPTLNDIPYSQIIILPDDTIQHMQEIYAQGQEIGRDPNSFSKLGDSIIANADFLTRFDLPGTYILGPYDNLQPVIDNFPGSWKRFGVAIRIGLRAWGVFDPAWANKDWCEPNEVLIDCEIRLNNPSILIIHLGSNDLDTNFDEFLRKTVGRTLELGVIPILLTKADRYEGDDNRNNITIRQAATDLAVPLIDFDVVAATLPNRGIKEGDNVHLSGPLAHDYNLPDVYEKGHTVHNLTVLLMMDRIWREVMGGGSGD